MIEFKEKQKELLLHFLAGGKVNISGATVDIEEFHLKSTIDVDHLACNGSIRMTPEELEIAKLKKRVLELESRTSKKKTFLTIDQVADLLDDIENEYPRRSLVDEYEISVGVYDSVKNGKHRHCVAANKLRKTRNQTVAKPVGLKIVEKAPKYISEPGEAKSKAIRVNGANRLSVRSVAEIIMMHRDGFSDDVILLKYSITHKLFYVIKNGHHYYNAEAMDIVNDEHEKTKITENIVRQGREVKTPYGKVQFIKKAGGRSVLKLV